MCGRYVLTKSKKVVQEHFQIFEEGEETAVQASFNVAPTDLMPVVRMSKDDPPKRQLRSMRWGLVPSWSKDDRGGARMINARAETAADKPAFRAAFAKRRCLVPSDGFFEWKKQGKTKQPYWIGLKDRGLFAYAGLWERWRSGDRVLDSFTVLTTEPNELVRELHDRMPVILAPSDYELWLDRSVESPLLLRPLLQAFSADRMEMFPVTTKVNSVRYRAPDAVLPLDGPEGQLDLL